MYDDIYTAHRYLRGNSELKKVDMLFKKKLIMVSRARLKRFKMYRL